jgi:hypothetical protein
MSQVKRNGSQQCMMPLLVSFPYLQLCRWLIGIGRISAAGFIPDLPFISSTRDTSSSSSAAVPPEAVLFRRKNAPIRYEESDFYFANDSLPPEALPDSDLLKALHCYSSDFYSRATTDGGSGDWRSLDETALLALGILMEELCRETLGNTGDMVFTEAEVNDERLDHKDFGKAEQSVINASEAATKSGRTRSRKRRRLSLEGSMDLID